jgi:hypothetical protein
MYEVALERSRSLENAKNNTLSISNSNLERSEQVARRGFLIVFESLSSLK